MTSCLMVFLFIMLNYGMSNMIVFSNGPFHVFEKFRAFANNLSEQLGELFSCMICYPTWNGFILSAVALITGVYFTPFTILFNGHYVLLTVLFDGCFGSGTTWLIHNIEEYFERANVTYEDEDEKIKINNG